MTRPRARPLLVPLAALLCLLAGLVVLALTPTAGRSYGWFAYAPLQSSGPVTSGLLVLTRGQCAAAALVVVGALLAAGAVGHRLGRSGAARD